MMTHINLHLVETDLPPLGIVRHMDLQKLSYLALKHECADFRELDRAKGRDLRKIRDVSGVHDTSGCALYYGNGFFLFTDLAMPGIRVPMREHTMFFLYPDSMTMADMIEIACDDMREVIHDRLREI